MSLETLQSLIGLPPSSPRIQSYLSSLSPDTAQLDPETKSFPDVTYINYHALGVSLCCVPSAGIKDGQTEGGIVVESFDLYNPRLADGQDKGRSRKRTFTTFRELPLEIRTTRDETFILDRKTTGTSLVTSLGEPSRKGGGIGWVDVWLEYSALGISVDLEDPRGDEVVSEEARKKGLGGVWDRAGGWVWSCVKVFKPQDLPGEGEGGAGA